MKKLKIILNGLIIFSMIVSCQDSAESIEINEINLESIEHVLNKLKETANEEKKVIWASVFLDEKGGLIVQNIEPLSPNDIGFIEGFGGVSIKNESKKSSGESVVISCSDGTITLCEGKGIGFYRCVGKAIQKCLDANGCAEVCSSGLVVEPE